jgi:hypothetical protein
MRLRHNTAQAKSKVKEKDAQVPARASEDGVERDKRSLSCGQALREWWVLLLRILAAMTVVFVLREDVVL